MLRGNSIEEQLQLHCRSVQLVMTGSNNSALPSIVQQGARFQPQYYSCQLKAQHEVTPYHCSISGSKSAWHKLYLVKHYSACDVTPHKCVLAGLVICSDIT